MIALTDVEPCIITIIIIKSNPDTQEYDLALP